MVTDDRVRGPAAGVTPGVGTGRLRWLDMDHLDCSSGVERPGGRGTAGHPEGWPAVAGEEAAYQACATSRTTRVWFARGPLRVNTRNGSRARTPSAIVVTPSNEPVRAT